MRSRLTLCAGMIAAAVAAATVAAVAVDRRRLAVRRPAQPGIPTYSKDVAPILQANCQVCHRPGEAGPFSLLTYRARVGVRPKSRTPWATDGCRPGSPSAPRQVLERHGSERLGHRHHRAMGRRRSAGGQSARSAEARAWVEGWGIGTPDLVVELPMPFEVPATGVVDYQHVIVPTNFTEDRWIQAAEIRPTERDVVHHLIAFVREPKSKWFRGQPAGVFFTAPKVSADAETEAGALPSDFLVGYVPGQPAEILEPGQGKLIKAGSDIVFQMHYTPHGHARTDRTRLGIVFAKTPPKKRVLTLSAVNDTFKIPPGHPNYQVDASFEVATDVVLASLHPHMHGRGKDFEYRAVFPSGKTEILLKVPRFDWHWQQWYNLATPLSPAEGHAARLHRAFRQLTEQPGGRRSDQGSDMGRPELGRDDDRVLQPGLRRQPPGRSALRQEAKGRDRRRRHASNHRPGRTWPDDSPAVR